MAGGGSVLETFLQPKEYYSGRDLFVLTPKREMSEKELLFYVTAIRVNKYKYSYGRQANKTLRNLLVPDSIHDWVKETDIPDYSELKSPVLKDRIDLDTSDWQYFKFTDLFEINKGKRKTKAQIQESLKTTDNPLIPFIAAKAENNAVRELCRFEPLCTEPAITVNYNGSVAEAFYQDRPYYASDDIIILTPIKGEDGNNSYNMTPEIAMFLSTVIRAEKYIFNYGRKWNLRRFKKDKIKLPSTANNLPDFDKMTRFINGLTYSNALSKFGE